MINSRTFVAGVPVKSKPDVSVCVSVHVDVCVWLNDSVTQNLITSVLRIAQPCAFAQLTLKFNPIVHFWLLHTAHYAENIVSELLVAVTSAWLKVPWMGAG